ncbi:MAG: hypothetical protein HOP19_20690 [Acidobacteria bacterium]|nr:hypothetical protein [Acidobacteriota bacterium]
MTIRRPMVRVLTMLILIVSLASFQVNANLTKAASNKRAAVMPKAAAPITGRLTADGPVTVNGNQARTGDTIFPGAVIETPANVGATIQLCALGQLDLSPNTNLTLNFDQENIRGELFKGCVILSANRGVNAVLKLANGEWLRAEAGQALNTCAADNCAALLAGARSARNNASASSRDNRRRYGMAFLWAGLGTLTGSLIGGGGGSPSLNPSPSAPQQ